MQYEVVILDGNGNSHFVDVEGVSEIQHSEGIIYFMKEEDEILLMVPETKLVYALYSEEK